MGCGEVYAAVFSLLEGVRLDAAARRVVADHVEDCRDDVLAAVSDWVGTRQAGAPRSPEEAAERVAREFDLPPALGESLRRAALGAARPSMGQVEAMASFTQDEYDVMLQALDFAAAGAPQPELRIPAAELLERLLIEGGEIVGPEELRRFREERSSRS